ncbi:MAG: 50S ribosomal protein L29 [Acidobacteriota bacterium]|nr:50S ribosomal protein L29 [Acidobacteriota bacterium]
MKSTELRHMPDHELSEQIADLRKELLSMRFANATGELENTSGLGHTKRSLARALTVARERALQTEGSPRAHS